MTSKRFHNKVNPFSSKSTLKSYSSEEERIQSSSTCYSNQELRFYVKPKLKMSTNKPFPDIFEMAESLEQLCMDSVDNFGYTPDPRNVPYGDSGGEKEQFPADLDPVLRALLGNKMCVDCFKFTELPWASVSFGSLMCEECAFEHISSGLAENLTNVRSLTKNDWNLKEVIALLEGGNAQFLKCIGVNFPEDQHALSTGSFVHHAEKRRGSLLSSRVSSDKFDAPDFTKYKKKNSKLYVKKLADRVEVVTTTFGSNSFNTRVTSRGIAEPTFKPMNRLSQPVHEYDGSSIDEEKSTLDVRASFVKQASKANLRTAFNPRASLGIRSSFVDPSMIKKKNLIDNSR